MQKIKYKILTINGVREELESSRFFVVCNK